MEMDIEISPAGSFNFDTPQQIWKDESSQIMQASRYAGHEMMAIQKSDDEPDIYELRYLGLEVSGFTSMDEAKLYAPQFAKAVFGELSKLINETN
ncbi:MAG: hypothetical protein V3U92_05580 [Cellulophaga sp.]